MKQNESREIIIQSLAELKEHVEAHQSLRRCTLQGLDLSQIEIPWEQVAFKETTLLGCLLPIHLEILLRERGATVYPLVEGLPYQPYRQKLYTWQELMKGYSSMDDNSVDLQIYQHFAQGRFNPSINEALHQRIHDHGIDEALRQLVGFDDSGMTTRRCVGFMGGHSMQRGAKFYVRTAQTARMVAGLDYFVVSGGGPGIMEAANLGAYFAEHSEKDLFDAINILSRSPHHHDPDYINQSYRVLEKYPHGRENLAIPTWFYEHEPSNLFASHIAKYFSNSIREDNLLAVSLYGVVYAPGSAGTTQEIFQEAAQNHYATHGYHSPMAFLSRERYEIKTSLFPLLKQLAWRRPYFDMLFLSDEPKEIVDFLVSHPPIPKEKAK